MKNGKMKRIVGKVLLIACTFIYALSISTGLNAQRIEPKGDWEPYLYMTNRGDLVKKLVADDDIFENPIGDSITLYIFSGSSDTPVVSIRESKIIKLPFHRDLDSGLL